MKKLIYLILLIPVLSLAQVQTPLPNTYVNDLAGKLNATEIQKLNESISAIEKKSSVQIAIILLSELPGNMSIEDYALNIGRQWHVGNAKNGLVYVVSFKERKQRIEVANNLQGLIPDVIAHDLTEEMKPYLKSQNYYNGLDYLIKQISEKIAPEVAEQKALGQAELTKKDDNDESFFYYVAFGIIFAIVLIAIIYFQNKKSKKKQAPAYALAPDFDDLYQSYVDNKTKSLIGKDENYIKKPDELSQHVYNETIRQNLTGRNRSPQPVYNRPPVNNPSEPIPYTSTIDHSAYIAPVNIDVPPKRDDDNNSSGYGDWGSGSSSSNTDTSNFDSSFSGGGSTNDF